MAWWVSATRPAPLVPGQHLQTKEAENLLNAIQFFSRIWLRPYIHLSLVS